AQGCGQRLQFCRIVTGPDVSFHQKQRVFVVGKELQAVQELRNSAFATESPHCSDRLVDQGRADGTRLHRKHIVGVATVVAQRKLGRVPHVHAGAIAVVPRRRRVKLNFVLEFELGSAAQRLAQNFGFLPQLHLIAHVLVVAAAAAAEVRTIRLDPIGRRRHHLCGFGASEAGAPLDPRDFNWLARQHKWHKDGFAAPLGVGRHARQAVATVNKFFDLYLQRRTIPDGTSEDVPLHSIPSATYRTSLIGERGTALISACGHIVGEAARFAALSSCGDRAPGHGQLRCVPRAKWHPESPPALQPKSFLPPPSVAAPSLPLTATGLAATNPPECARSRQSLVPAFAPSLAIVGDRAARRCDSGTPPPPTGPVRCSSFRLGPCPRRLPSFPPPKSAPPGSSRQGHSPFGIASGAAPTFRRWHQCRAARLPEEYLHLSMFPSAPNRGSRPTARCPVGAGSAPRSRESN